MSARQSIEPFVFGTVTVPDGKSGPWEIDSFTLTREDVLMGNMRAIRDGNPHLVVPPGSYRRLTHKTRDCVMSTTPMEIRTAREAFDNANGDVLINGLGLGMVLEGVLSKPSVTSVTVVEIDKDVIKLVAPHYCKDRRVMVINDDAYTYEPMPHRRFHYVWHDIWDSIDPDHLPDMTKLVRRYRKFADQQGVWSRDMARREKRRFNY